MSILLIILLVIFLIGGLFIVPLGLPGTWVITGAAFLYSIFADFVPGVSDWWVVGILVSLALVAEALEYGVSILASKTMKVSTGALVSSIIGGIIGAIIGTPVIIIGSLIGLLIGTFLGAFAYEMAVRRDVTTAFKAALASFFSRVTSLFVKTLIALGMVVYVLIKLF